MLQYLPIIILVIGALLCVPFDIAERQYKRACARADLRKRARCIVTSDRCNDKPRSDAHYRRLNQMRAMRVAQHGQPYTFI